MANDTVDVTVLSRGLDQAAGLIDPAGDADPASPTPCHEWSVAELVDHLVGTTETFARAVRGEQVDWSAPPSVSGDRGETFRAAAQRLLDAWSDSGPVEGPGPEWQCAELAVHTYDLATALGRPTGDLDPDVAEVGLAFMRANLTPEMRGEAFEPERPAPDGADAYQRIAAFAGRSV